MPPSGNLRSSKPRALLISPEAPYPMYGGGPLRTVSLIEYLRKRYTVDLIVFRNDYLVPIPPETFGNVLQIRLPFHSRQMGARIWRNAGRLVRQRPPLVDRFSGFEAAMNEWLRGKTYDVAVFEHFWVAPYVGLIRQYAQRLVLDLHNVESELMGLPFRAAARRMEAKLLPLFDTILVTSAQDAAKIPVQSVIYPNCIPDGPMPARQEQLAIGMSANFEFFPNLLGVRWFARRVWPTVRDAFPGLQWRLIGKNPQAVSRWTSGDSQIVTTGPIPDAIGEIARCRAAIVPIQYGSGTRLKILEAWAAGTPVISTSKGCEGLNAETGKTLMVADTPSTFADAVSQVLRDSLLRDRLRGEGRTQLCRDFVWSQTAKRLDDSRVL